MKTNAIQDVAPPESRSLVAPGPRAVCARQAIRDKLIEDKHYIAKQGEDTPEIRNWKWSGTNDDGQTAAARQQAAEKTKL